MDWIDDFVINKYLDMQFLYAKERGGAVIKLREDCCVVWRVWHAAALEKADEGSAASWCRPAGRWLYGCALESVLKNVARP